MSLDPVEVVLAQAERKAAVGLVRVVGEGGVRLEVEGAFDVPRTFERFPVVRRSRALAEWSGAAAGGGDADVVESRFGGEVVGEGDEALPEELAPFEVPFVTGDPGRGGWAELVAESSGFVGYRFANLAEEEMLANR